MRIDHPNPAHQFTDAAGRFWTCRVNAVVFIEARDLLGVKWDEPAKFFERVAGDIAFAVDMIALTCRQDREAAGLSEMEFVQSLTPANVDTATTALIEAVIDALPKKIRRLTRELWLQVESINSKSLEILTEKIRQAAAVFDG